MAQLEASLVGSNPAAAEALAGVSIVQQATRRKRRAQPRFGVALAGGGPLGAIYEIGALAALSEALDGIDFNEADVYVGVSAGGFIAAGLANGITPHQFPRFFIEGDESSVDHFDPARLLKPAWGEFRARLADLPALVASAAYDWLLGGQKLASTVARLGRAIPTGLFDGSEIDRYLSDIFSQPGRTNDFHELRHKLYLVATNLDTGASVTFGGHGHAAVPISVAVQATAALPGLFPPVRIGNADYVDGALRKTLHASVALEEDLDLLFCLNPIVPFDASAGAGGERAHRRPLHKMVDGGLPVVISQTFRSIIHSRLGTGFERYRKDYPQTDILLLEPSRADAAIFFANLFSYAARRRLCEHAYRKTRKDLWVRRHELAPLLARHGIELRTDVLADRGISLIKSLGGPETEAGTARNLGQTLDDLERWLRLTHPAAHS